jgi:hypothetical protein
MLSFEPQLPLGNESLAVVPFRQIGYANRPTKQALARAYQGYPSSFLPNLSTTYFQLQ